jgi:hypothetical protein
MASLVRWLRGALGIGVTWTVLWLVIGLLIYTVIRIVDPADIGPGEGLGTALPILGLVGFLSGLGFAALLSLAERRRTLHELPLWRVAFWGMLGSAAVPLLMGTDASMGGLTGALGATFAAASLAIARRGAARVDEPAEAAATDA